MSPLTKHNADFWPELTEATFSFFPFFLNDVRTRIHMASESYLLYSSSKSWES